MNQSICAVGDCIDIVGDKGARGWCPKHYQRVLSTGDPLGRKCGGCSVYLTSVFGDDVKRRRYCSEDCKPRCKVDGCDSPVRKLELCGSHAHQAYVKGEAVPFKYKWPEVGIECPICGAESGSKKGYRSVCSGACRAVLARFPHRATATDCLSCGESISLRDRDANGRLRTSRTLLCVGCRRRFRRPSLNASQLADRDGTTCYLCHRSVDLDVKWPDRMSPSVDHVEPLSRGGSEDPSNLALVHLTCNTSKQDKVHI